MSRAPRVAAAAAVLLLALPAAAFHRTETSTVGRCLWWGTDRVTYRLNTTKATTAGCGTIDDVKALARASFATWGAAAFAGGPVCTGFAFVDGGDSTNLAVGANGENLVVWRVGLCSVVAANDPCRATLSCADTFNCWENDDTVDHTAITIALTTTSYRPDTGEIFDADMELNDDGGTGAAGFAFTCYAGQPARTCTTTVTPTCTSMDLGSTLTHEAGHMLGLAHPCRLAGNCPTAADATMFGSAGIGETKKRTLADDDIEGVCTIYPAGGPPQSGGGTSDSDAACVALPARESKGCGCGTVGAGDLALLAGLAALARLRRPRPRA